MTDPLQSTYLDAYRPPPILSIHEWAARNLHLTSKETSRPGPYDPHVTPYLIEVLERLSPADPCQFVYLMWGAQLGKSQGLNATLGFYIAHEPSPCLLMQPTVELAKTYSKQRIATMISNSPLLRTLVSDPKSRDGSNTMGLKEFPGGLLVMVGANAPTMMRSMPMRIAMFDEVDGYPQSAGGEGSPIQLGIERTNAFPARKILLTSTPATKGSSRIEHAFLSTGQRYYHVPCPHCSTMQRLEWDRLMWDGDKHRTAYMQCENEACTERIYDRHKATMLPAGEWRAEHPDKEDGDAYGYHLSGLYAPLGWSPVSWPNIVRKYLLAQGDPQRERVFVNTTLAETYDEFAAEDFDETGLSERRETYAAPVPAGVAVLTAGVDVQGDRVECEIVGWGPGEESFSIDYTVIPGDPTGAELWNDLEQHLLKVWRHETAGPMTLAAVAIDCGHETTKVQQFTHKHRRRRWYAVKGLAGVGKPLWPKRGKRGKKGMGEMYHSVGINDAKATNWRRLRKLEPGPGCMHFPEDRDLEWFKQLVSEVPRTGYVKGHPRKQWFRRSAGAKAEALDCRVYAYCVLYSYLRVGRTLQQLHDALPVMTETQTKRAMVPPKPAANRPPISGRTAGKGRKKKASGFTPRF